MFKFLNSRSKAALAMTLAALVVVASANEAHAAPKKAVTVMNSTNTYVDVNIPGVASGYLPPGQSGTVYFFTNAKYVTVRASNGYSTASARVPFRGSYASCSIIRRGKNGPLSITY
jgi:hypothetical protein